MANELENQLPQKAFGWAATDSSGILSPIRFSRRATGVQDVKFKVLYCGICHSDLHFIKNEWGFAYYPAIPGHEIVGEVTEIGSKVQKFKVGDKVGVGCMVGSCRSCYNCADHRENYCPKVMFTYRTTHYDGTKTYGGYSDIMVVEEHFAIRIPEGVALDATAPLLCAGITVYSPLKYFKLDQPGLHIGVVGLGGLGHMAVKFAKAFGAKVTVISTSPNKKDEAINCLGADSFLVSHEPEQLQAAMGTMDGIIDTVSAVHPLVPLLGLLKTNGKLVLVGAPVKPLELPAFPLLMGGKIVAGSAIGGIKETQEMIDFSAKHGIKADIEVIPIDYVNTAMERLLKRDVRATGAQDVKLKVLYCGICHSDLHFIKNEWGNAYYPAIPGHEIVGEVIEIGSKVQNFKVGDKVGVGCLVGSCRSCDSCVDNHENYCPKLILTYGSTYYDGTLTYGGYSNIMVVDEHFAIHIPKGIALDATAPLLCAGITVYSPLKYFKLDQPGLHVGVVGLGGLGHMAVKFAKAFGAKVTVISTSPNKKDEAINRLGADTFLVSREPKQIQAAIGTMDGIIDTVSAAHPLLPLIGLLKTNGKLVLVGAPEKPLELPAFPLLMGRKIVAGSCIGGIKETQEMIDFAAKHDIKADIEVIPMDYVNTAMERLVKADVRYRFVIDIGNTLKAE